MFIAFRLKPGRDDDLIAWLKDVSEGDRSYHIREALRWRLDMQIPGYTLPAVKIEPEQAAIRKQEKSEAELEIALDNWI